MKIKLVKYKAEREISAELSLMDEVEISWLLEKRKYTAAKRMEMKREVTIDYRNGTILVRRAA